MEASAHRPATTSNHEEARGEDEEEETEEGEEEEEARKFSRFFVRLLLLLLPTTSSWRRPLFLTLCLLSASSTHKASAARVNQCAHTHTHTTLCVRSLIIYRPSRFVCANVACVCVCNECVLCAVCVCVLRV